MNINRFSLLVLLLAAFAALASAAPLRLRGGGILTDIANRLGWKRSKVGTTSLGCGQMPKKASVHISKSAGVARSGFAIILDIADCESFTAKPPKTR